MPGICAQFGVAAFSRRGPLRAPIFDGATGELIHGFTSEGE
jgi:hypothetical protein